MTPCRSCPLSLIPHSIRGFPVKGSTTIFLKCSTSSAWVRIKWDHARLKAAGFDMPCWSVCAHK